MSTTAPLNIAQAGDLVDLSIQKVFVKTSEPEVMYPKYFNVRSTEDYYEKDSSLSGLGEADFVDENSVIISDIPIQGYDKTYTQNMVGVIIPFTFKMWKFGIKKRDLNNVAKELKAACARKKEKLCAERLDNGFESTSYTHTGAGGTRTITTSGGDSLGAFDDDHTREDGGTNMNNYVYDGTNYNLVFDYSGLKAAHRTASLFVDPRGNPRGANLDTLVCKKGSTASFKAKEILGAIKSGKIPESMDNDSAAVPAFKILELDYLSNSAYWYMFDSSRALKDEEGFQFVESQGVVLDPVNVVYKTKELQTSVTTIFDLGHNDVARCWVASKGDSSAVSD
jgi:hypothetical protein